MPAVAQALLSAVSPGMRLAFARHLIPLREPLFAELIEETAKTNALYALTTGLAEAVPVLDVPLNLADIVVLTKNQLVMSYRIALASGKKGTPRDLVGEVLGVIGGGFLFRQGARQLVGLIPVAGIVPKVAVAYAGTLAIGKAVVTWAAYGTSPRARRHQETLSAGALTGQGRGADPRHPSTEPGAPPPMAPSPGRMIVPQLTVSRPQDETAPDNIAPGNGRTAPGRGGRPRDDRLRPASASRPTGRSGPGACTR